MKRRLVIVLFALLSLPFVVGAPAAQAANDDITARVQSAYDTLTGFRANFEQHLTNAASGETSVSSGSLSFKNPRLVRWVTAKPQQELLIMGPEFVWQYIPAENTAIKNDVQDVLTSKTMLRFIAGEADLQEDFMVEPASSEDADTVKLQLIPREPDPTLILATVWVDPQTALFSRVQLTDFYGNVNDVRLSDVQLNPELPDMLFTLVVPEGVRVRDNTGGPMPGLPNLDDFGDLGDSPEVGETGPTTGPTTDTP